MGRRIQRLGSLGGVVAALLLPASSSAAITEFPTGGDPTDIVTGPDKALWFTSPNSGQIGRLTTGGTVSKFSLPTEHAGPIDITAGPDSALWFTESFAGKIGRITTAGKVSEFPLPNGITPTSITRGPDGALWFFELVSAPALGVPLSACQGAMNIGRITTTGAITAFPTTSKPACGLFSPQTEGITVGPGGALWFADYWSDKIGRITTSGQLTEFPVGPGSHPESLASGRDGALWFTERATDKIGRLTTTGNLSEFGTPEAKSDPVGIIAGPDGALWFTEHGIGKIGRITTAGRISEYPGGLLAGITVGPDRAIWFTDATRHAAKIGRITTPAQKDSCAGLKDRALRRCAQDTHKQALAKCKRIAKKDRRTACVKRENRTYHRALTKARR